MISVGISGFGTVGRRVTNAVTQQEDMTVSGVAKTSPSATAREAEKRYGLYGVKREHREKMQNSGLEVLGTLDNLCEMSDVIIDCSPSGLGKKNKPIYQEHGVKTIYQGGEKSEIADKSYNSYALKKSDNDNTDVNSLRVVSCNTTGLSRLVTALQDSFDVEKISGTIIRRGGDPGEIERGPINDIVPTMNIPSHHSTDLNEVVPNIKVSTKALKSPTTSMHMHSLDIEIEDYSSVEEIKQQLQKYNRICLIPEGFSEIRSSADIREISQMNNRPYGSVWENTVWTESISDTGWSISLFQGVHQRSIVVPENIDAVRYIMGENIGDSIHKTDRTLGIGELFD
jgi:glyceraldehyde-3-phosphate dehydrogenase (NAD(P))